MSETQPNNGEVNRENIDALLKQRKEILKSVRSGKVVSFFEEMAKTIRTLEAMAEFAIQDKQSFQRELSEARLRIAELEGEVRSVDNQLKETQRLRSHALDELASVRERCSILSDMGASLFRSVDPDNDDG